MSRTAKRLSQSKPRSEFDWLTWSEPLTMLEVLRAKASDRKVRLFATGCGRLTLTDSSPAQSERAIEVAERYADGLAKREELLRARSRAFHAAQQFSTRKSEELWEQGIHHFPQYMSGEEVRLFFIAEAAHPHTPFRIGLLRHWLRVDRRLMRMAPGLIRDVLGNPFHTVDFAPTWHQQSIVDLAQALYNDRDFERMPELADALEGAGCHDAQILDHCRGSGPHVRGCWVVDVLLGQS